MLKVTAEATQELKELLDENGIEGESAFKLHKNADGSLGFSVASTQEGDQVVRHEERKVLLVDGELSAVLTNVQMDVEKTVRGPQFILAPLRPSNGKTTERDP